MDGFVIVNRKDLTAKQTEEIDSFILKNSTNGEFINSIRFLDYHPADRFEDDSIAVIDCASKRVWAVMMGAKVKGKDVFISHPGTTFAGPIVDRKYSAAKIEGLLDLMLTYYENKYNEVHLKIRPSYYDFQSMGIIDFFLLKRGYTFGSLALANTINISGIQSENDILMLFDSKRRNEVRKAQKENLFRFERNEVLSEAVWDNMNKNLSQRFSAKTTHTYAEISDLYQRFPQNIQPYYMYTHDERYGAFGLIFQFKNVFHTQYLDLNYEYAKNYPNLLLIYNLIKEARERNCSFFSFGASTEGSAQEINYGLYNYKAGYGGGDIVLPVFSKKMR